MELELEQAASGWLFSEGLTRCGLSIHLHVSAECSAMKARVSKNYACVEANLVR